MTLEEVKQWVVRKAKVNKPMGRDWSAHTTLGIDIFEMGDTIEKAYNKLANRIYNSNSLRKELEKIISKS